MVNEHTVVSLTVDSLFVEGYPLYKITSIIVRNSRGEIVGEAYADTTRLSEYGLTVDFNVESMETYTIEVGKHTTNSTISIARTLANVINRTEVKYIDVTVGNKTVRITKANLTDYMNCYCYNFCNAS